MRYLSLVQEFMQHRALYSWNYFDLMESQLNEQALNRVQTIQLFLSLLLSSEPTNCNLCLLFERFLKIKGALEQIKTIAKDLLSQAKLSMDVLIP